MTLIEACARWLLPSREATPWAAVLRSASPRQPERAQPDMIMRLDAWQASRQQPRQPGSSLVTGVRPILVRGQPWHLPDEAD